MPVPSRPRPVPERGPTWSGPWALRVRDRIHEPGFQGVRELITNRYTKRGCHEEATGDPWVGVDRRRVRIRDRRWGRLRQGPGRLRLAAGVQRAAERAAEL